MVRISPHLRGSVEDVAQDDPQPLGVNPVGHLCPRSSHEGSPGWCANRGKYLWKRARGRLLATWGAREVTGVAAAHPMSRRMQKVRARTKKKSSRLTF